MTSERFGAVCAFLFVVLFVAGVLILDLPGHDDGDERLNAFYADSGNRLQIVLLLASHSGALS